MLQHSQPEDFVIATGEQHSVREFVELAAGHFGMAIEWRGSGVDEVGIDSRTGNTIVRVDARYFRPTEVDSLLGDAGKARRLLGWQPEVDFATLVREMAQADWDHARRDKLVSNAGFRTARNLE
jgi:GDPmannose 4,6-dehydratase